MHGPQNVKSVYYPTYTLCDKPYVHSHMFRHLGPSGALEAVNVQWICYVTRHKKTHRYVDLQNSRCLHSVISSPGLLPLFMVKTVNIPAAKMETVVGSRDRRFWFAD